LDNLAKKCLSFLAKVYKLYSKKGLTEVGLRPLTLEEGYTIVLIQGTHKEIEVEYTAEESWVNFVFGAATCVVFPSKKVKIGHSVKSMSCDGKTVLAHMPDGGTLKYDGKPNFWSPFKGN
jgi:hypothetical protein